MILYTVGYSDFFEEGKLINKFKEKGIKEVVDVRTFPFSNAFSQYDQPIFTENLKREGMEYTFLGEYLGGLIFKNHFRRGISSVYDLVEDKSIKVGMNRLYKIAKKESTVIMCAEKEPFNCHRLAISFLFKEKAGFQIVNLFSDKEESFEKTISRFKVENRLDNLDLNNEQLVKNRLELLYRFNNKREERFPKKQKNLKLF